MLRLATTATTSYNLDPKSESFTTAQHPAHSLNRKMHNRDRIAKVWHGVLNIKRSNPIIIVSSAMIPQNAAGQIFDSSLQTSRAPLQIQSKVNKKYKNQFWDWFIVCMCAVCSVVVFHVWGFRKVCLWQHCVMYFTFLPSLSLLGDVLQLSLPIRGAFLFPGKRFAAKRSSGWHRSHVHPEGERKTDFF